MPEVIAEVKMKLMKNEMKNLKKISHGGSYDTTAPYKIHTRF